MRVLMCAGVAESLGPDIDRARDRTPGVGRAAGAGRPRPVGRPARRRGRAATLSAPSGPLISHYDAVLTFAASGPAPLAAQGTGDPIFATFWTLIGAPAYSLPLMRAANGLPIGVQAVGAPGRDLDLTRAAAWLMRAAAWLMRAGAR